MCHQITYTLPCEHVRTQIIYCADALVAPSSGRSKSSRSSGTQGAQPPLSKRSSASTTAAGAKYYKPCRSLTQQSSPYPTPPSFAGDPSTAASSPLAPKCPLSPCPFEAKNRCWNCCWCGKGWNLTGRCSCVMIIEGSEVQCEHICCHNCEAAG